MISVVIPLFNKGPHISKALDSVLAQTVPPEEIMVIDDGSIDNGPEIVTSYKNQGVRLIRQPNQGASVARNAGIASAKYDYIAFLDADDWWFPNHLEIIKRLALTYPSAGLLSTAHVIFREGSSCRPSLVFPDDWEGEVLNFFDAYAKNLSLVNSSTACVNRSAINSVGGFPIGVRRGEDVIVWIKLALRYSMAYAETVTAVYNQQAVNRSDTHRDLEPPGSLLYMAKLLRDGDLHPPLRQSVGKLFDQISFMTAAGFLLNGDRIGARAICKLALGLNRLKAFSAISWALLLPLSVLRAARRLRHRKFDE